MESPDPNLPIFPLGALPNLPESDRAPLAGEPSGSSLEQGGELNPWFVLEGDHENLSVALWELQQGGEPCVVLFSTEDLAKAYAQAFCKTSYSIRQVERPAMLRILIESFKGGVQHAALDPQGATTRRVFRLRDVLKAAKSQLQLP